MKKGGLMIFIALLALNIKAQVPYFGATVGIIHSWKFDEDIDLAIGAYYVYKEYSFYIWRNDFFSSHPRATVALDFSF